MRHRNLLYWLATSLRMTKWTIKAMILGNLNYKTNFVLTILNTFVGILSYAFLGSTIVYQKGIEDYGVSSSIAFLLSGYIALYLLGPLEGHLEFSAEFYNLMSLMPVPLWCIFFSRTLLAFTKTLSFILVILFIAFLFGVSFNVNIFLLMYTLLFSVLLGIGVGLLSSGVNFIVKKGNPIRWIIDILESLLSGRWFPITILPTFLRYFSWILPSTPLNYCLRTSLFAGASPINFLHFIIFASTSLSYFLLGYIVFWRGVQKIRREGLIL